LSDFATDRHRLHAVALIAQYLLAGAKTMFAIAIVGGVALWSLLLIPFVIRWWTVLFSAMLLVFLLLPSAVTGLFYVALRQILQLPSELIGSLTEGRSRVATLIQGVRGKGAEGAGRRVGLVMGIWALSRALLESRGLVVGAAGLARLANPITVIIVLGAMGLGVAEVLIAIAVGLLRVSW
jgi:hypothetical protein